MTNTDRITVDGIVTATSNSKFTIRVNEKYFVTATIGGKLRQNGVRIIVGDRVTTEVSVYDLNSGRIVYRHRN